MKTTDLVDFPATSEAPICWLEAAFAIKTIADEFAAQEHHAAALTIYEVLVNEIIDHFNDYRAGKGKLTEKASTK